MNKNSILDQIRQEAFKNEIEKISMSASRVMSALPIGLSAMRSAEILKANPGQLNKYRKTARGLIEQAQRLRSKPLIPKV